MNKFATQAEAKEYLAQAIVREANAQGTPLSQDDRLLLYFTEREPETAKAIPRERLLSDDSEYEERITGYFKSIYTRSKESADGEWYREAAAKLHEGDHYLSIMVDLAIAQADTEDLPTSEPGTIRMSNLRDLLIYVVIGVIVVLVGVAIAIIKARNG